MYFSKMNPYTDKFLANEQNIQGSMRYEGLFLTALICEMLNAFECYGDMMEIGIYKGRSAIAAACFLNENENFWAVDPFENIPNDEKIVAGGIGDHETFIMNWISVFGHTNNLKIFAQTSKDFSLIEADIKKKMKSKYISIDGDHSKTGTIFDLTLANRLTKDHGIIVVDDCFNIEWPSGVIFKSCV